MSVNQVEEESQKVKGVYIGLGSNIDNPEMQIHSAIAALNKLSKTKVIMDSGCFSSKPMGPKDQPDYINAVVEIETCLSPQALLDGCQKIEQLQGRIKKCHWGERIIDLDLLLYLDREISTDKLTVPHPGVCLRDFVYMPLLKINPELHIPGKGMLKVIVESDDNSKSDFSCQFVGNVE